MLEGWKIAWGLGSALYLVFKRGQHSGASGTPLWHFAMTLRNRKGSPGSRSPASPESRNHAETAPGPCSLDSDSTGATFPRTPRARPSSQLYVYHRDHREHRDEECGKKSDLMDGWWSALHKHFTQSIPSRNFLCALCGENSSMNAPTWPCPP